MKDLKNTQVQDKYPLGDFETNPRGWLAKQAGAIGAKFFWGYAENGALWGRFEEAGLKLAGDAFSEFNIALDPKTLLQARVFGDAAELFLWREGSSWQARLIRDLAEDQDVISRKYWLWGTPHVDANGAIEMHCGFTLFVEGAQGMRHAPPRDDWKPNQRAALQVKHYVAYDEEEGQAYVALSRLVGIGQTQEPAK